MKGKCMRLYTDKKENKIFLRYKAIQMGTVAKSYMRKGKKGESVRKDKKSKKGWECTKERRTRIVGSVTKDREARSVGSTQREEE
jgi:hypothetical protein